MTEGGGPSSSRVRAAAISSGPRVRRPAAQSHGGGGVQFYWKKEEGDVGVPARLDQKGEYALSLLSLSLSLSLSPYLLFRSHRFQFWLDFN